MVDYHVLVHYRMDPAPEGLEPGDPDYWDGQSRVRITLDQPLGESGEGINNEMADILRVIGTTNGYSAVALAAHPTEGTPWIEEAEDD